MTTTTPVRSVEEVEEILVGHLSRHYGITEEEKGVICKALRAAQAFERATLRTLIDDKVRALEVRALQTAATPDAPGQGVNVSRARGLREAADAFRGLLDVKRIYGDPQHYADALTWIEANASDGIALVANALAETAPKAGHGG